MYSISQLSQQTGVSNKTIRYYERISLLPQPSRASNGYRQYIDQDVDRLKFVQRLRLLDFTLADIREILAFKERNEAPCNYVMTVISEQVDAIAQQIHELKLLQEELNHFHAAGQVLPEDVDMKTCICHVIKTADVKQKSLNKEGL